MSKFTFSTSPCDNLSVNAMRLIQALGGIETELCLLFTDATTDAAKRCIHNIVESIQVNSADILSEIRGEELWRTVLMLYYQECLTPSVISDKTGFPLATVNYIISEHDAQMREKGEDL